MYQPQPSETHYYQEVFPPAHGNFFSGDNVTFMVVVATIAIVVIIIILLVHMLDRGKQEKEITIAQIQADAQVKVAQLEAGADIKVAELEASTRAPELAAGVRADASAAG